MPYDRPKPPEKIPANEKSKALSDYINHYRLILEKEPDAINRKIPRKVFEPILSEIGELIKRRVQDIANGQDGPTSVEVKKFLEANPLPVGIKKLLTPELRTFALLLQSLKQWAAAESLAVDHWLISGQPRKTLRSVTDKCLISGDVLTSQNIELHHPVRDGRPPIPLSKAAHRKIEKQQSSISDDAIGEKLKSLRKEGNHSWRLIWEGCCQLMGQKIEFSSKNRGSYSRSIARKYARKLEASVEAIRAWIEVNELVKNA